MAENASDRVSGPRSVGAWRTKLRRVGDNRVSGQAGVQGLIACVRRAQIVQQIVLYASAGLRAEPEANVILAPSRAVFTPGSLARCSPR
jgi:hypothetical protein